MIRRNLINALVGLVVFVVLMGVLGYLFEPELVKVTTWIVERIGFAGMAVILAITDSLVTPFPPDILLVIIANSPLAANWPMYVGLLGVVSVCAGMTGYSIGRWLGHFAWTQRLFGHFKTDHHDFIRKYGFWAVVVGAVTPLPYSVTCWTSGVLGVRWTTVLAASVLFRIPRFYLFYWLLTSTHGLFGSA
ncbi:MAG: VTT domain-containing protein [Serpentinimonas sp.]|jgi:membrane protein YqaA with SNARE-associated domain|nr:VTT domain-containing protein [Serpentinimonas sp.]